MITWMLMLGLLQTPVIEVPSEFYIPNVYYVQLGITYDLGQRLNFYGDFESRFHKGREDSIYLNPLYDKYTVGAGFKFNDTMSLNIEHFCSHKVIGYSTVTVQDVDMGLQSETKVFFKLSSTVGK